MAAKTKKWSKLPTAEDIRAFNGMHCSKSYSKLIKAGWRCPSCNRTPQELIRWSEIRGPSMRKLYGDEHGMGWTISIAKHHCHSRDFYTLRKSERFPPTYICGDCNFADGAVKRKFKLNESWSFSPQEISQFVTVTPHSGRTIIDYEVAKTIFNRHRLPFQPPLR
jgi:hypothetical protein